MEGYAFMARARRTSSPLRRTRFKRVTFVLAFKAVAASGSGHLRHHVVRPTGAGHMEGYAFMARARRTSSPLRRIRGTRITFVFKTRRSTPLCSRLRLDADTTARPTGADHMEGYAFKARARRTSSLLQRIRCTRIPSSLRRGV
jgi:hypothetical protein